MANITSWSQLEAIINQEIQQGLKIVGNEIKTIIEDYVKKEVYDAHSPSHYDRTGDLLNSLDVSEVTRVGNSYQVTVFFNTAHIHSNFVDSGWNQHMSANGLETWKGTPVYQLIPIFIEHGVKNSLWDREGIESMKYVREQLEKTNRHLKTLSAILRKRGFSVKIV